jgi:hypothetical protein
MPRRRLSKADLSFRSGATALEERPLPSSVLNSPRFHHGGKRETQPARSSPTMGVRASDGKMAPALHPSLVGRRGSVAPDAKRQARNGSGAPIPIIRPML